MKHIGFIGASGLMGHGIAKNLLEDANKFVRYGMMQFLGPLIASFYPLDRGRSVDCLCL